MTDCGIRRGSCAAIESTRERLIRLLPPDGGTISCLSRPDLIPLRKIASTTYLHDLVCESGLPVPYDPVNQAVMIGVPFDPNDHTQGGAMAWINETQIRLYFGPRDQPPCELTDLASIYVSNDPGDGLGGALVSNPAPVRFTNTTPCTCGLTAGLRAVSDVCPGGSLTLDASATIPGSCPGGIEYQFEDETSILRPFSAVPTLAVTPLVPTTYTLRARCTGDPICAQSATTAHVEVLVDTVPGAQGNALLAVRTGADVRLEFPAAPALRWMVLRDGDKSVIGQTRYPPDATTTAFVDAGAAADANAYFYALRGLSPCTFQPGP